MHKPVTFGIVAISCLIALLATDRIAQGQAGSIGGTIGKTDKSVSGGDKETEPQRASSCAKLIGVWSWFIGGDVTFKSDGSYVQPQSSLTGTWTCKSDYVLMLWSHGYTDRLTLSRDGTHLEGSNSNGFDGVSGDRK
jgi:hypothetical protein